MTDLLAFIHSFSDFSEESWNLLRPIITKIEFKKADYLVQADKICNSLFFISKGYCRAFNVQDGVEVNTCFYFENDIATNMNSYVFNIKSSFAIQACEPVTAYKFDKSKVLEVSKKAPEIELIAKRNLQLIAARQEKQLQLYRLLTAKQRYEYLEKNEIEILQRVPLTQLASYLGVTRETLSRIRNKRLQK
ncbi:MAG: Crp/Fnr family transcriptional regulator [Chitinophagaceae bacterium]|nr:Crp/Fnr family transcriptional regulator [Chitinophagaceae bacterium]